MFMYMSICIFSNVGVICAYIFASQINCIFLLILLKIMCLKWLNLVWYSCILTSKYISYLKMILFFLQNLLYYYSSLLHASWSPEASVVVTEPGRWHTCISYGLLWRQLHSKLAKIHVLCSEFSFFFVLHWKISTWYLATCVCCWRS